MEKREEYAKCTDEQSFKMMFLRRFKSPRFYHFCIETEETIKGFPDVLVIDKFDSKADFIEFKFTKTGKIKFQPTQPAFYKSHPELMINVLAYNAKSQQLHTIDVNELFKEGSAYQMNEKAEVDLCKAEVRMTEVEKELYRDKNGKLLGQCILCRRQLVRPTTSINRIIPELEARQSERYPSLCWACENVEYVARMKHLRSK